MQGIERMCDPCRLSEFLFAAVTYTQFMNGTLALSLSLITIISGLDSLRVSRVPRFNVH